MSIIFGVKKFHKYIYGRKFNLLTDHKALTTIFGPRKGVPTLAALRLQRWSLILMAYDYDITYRRSEEHSNADFLSRAPMLLQKILNWMLTTSHTRTICQLQQKKLVQPR